MRLCDLTWAEVEAYLSETRSLIIPAGTCEQHSRHLPLDTDTLVAEHVANFLSGETGILVAPTIAYGVNLPCDRYYAGTCSVSERVLRGTLSDIIEWWRLQGFEVFYVLSAHGDPFHLKALSPDKDASVFLLDLYDLDLEDVLESQAGCGHACEVETSVMLYLFPEKVRKEAIEDFQTPFEIFKGYLHHERTDPLPGSPGCQGYPSKATREKGEIIVSRMKENALAWILRWRRP